MNEGVYNYHNDFVTEKGEVISGLTIKYHSAGKLNANRDNVIWVCHALTANSNVAEWWPNMVGDGLLFDTSKYFVVCANILGSCYGTTGPLSNNPKFNFPYFHEFPAITIRDMVNAHEILREHLRIENIFLLVGGSIGGFQAFEWSILHPDIIKHLFVIASGVKASPWNIAFNESQRLAIEADPTFAYTNFNAGENGLKAARTIALLSYRNSFTYNTTQKEVDDDKLADYKAVSYQQYQGEKLVKRFNALSYYLLTKAFDSHNVGRGRRGVNKALSMIKAKTLIVAIDSDLLFPVTEIQEFAVNIPDCEYKLIKSDYGHDGFLIETNKITEVVKAFINKH